MWQFSRLIVPGAGSHASAKPPSKRQVVTLLSGSSYGPPTAQVFDTRVLQFRNGVTSAGSWLGRCVRARRRDRIVVAAACGTPSGRLAGLHGTIRPRGVDGYPGVRSAAWSVVDQTRAPETKLLGGRKARARLANSTGLESGLAVTYGFRGTANPTHDARCLLRPPSHDASASPGLAASERFERDAAIVAPASVVDCGMPVMRRTYRATMRAKARRSRLGRSMWLER